jgi:hypothetical protein
MTICIPLILIYMALFLPLLSLFHSVRKGRNWLSSFYDYYFHHAIALSRIQYKKNCFIRKQNAIIQLLYCFILGLFVLVSNCFIQVCNPIDVIIFTMQWLNYVFNIIRIALYIQLSRNCFVSSTKEGIA